MSGHSHWSTIKRQKQSEDAKKSKLFAKLLRNIILAVQEGGGVSSPENNPHLRVAVEKARAANIPKSKIIQAIKRAAAREKKDAPKTIFFGALIQDKFALLLEAFTDNQRRTAGEIKKVLSSKNGVLVSYESIKPYFKQVGIIQIDRGERSEDACLELALAIGAEDFQSSAEDIEFFVSPLELNKVKEKLVEQGVEIKSASLQYQPKIRRGTSKQLATKALEEVVAALEQLVDIRRIYSVQID